MTPQIEQLKELFELALSQPSAERNAFVREACSGDWELESELSSLLRAHDESAGFFEKLSDELIAPALSAVELDDQDDSAGIGSGSSFNTELGHAVIVFLNSAVTKNLVQVD